MENTLTGYNGNNYNLINLTKEKLSNLYYVNKLSQSKIAKMFNVNQTAIFYLMKKYNIKSRSISESLKGSLNPFYGKKHSKRSKSIISKKNSHARNGPIQLSNEHIQVLEGPLLSDGHIDSNKYSGRYTQGCKYKEFLQHIREILPLNWGPIWYDKKMNCYHMKSRFTPMLLEFRNKWYQERKKIIPRDIKLFGKTLLYWFLGDGSIPFNNKKKFPNSKYFEIKLSTQGFSRKDLIFILEKLRTLNIYSSLLKSNKLRVLSSSKERFFNLMGDCSIDCYKYKWRGVM